MHLLLSHKFKCWFWYQRNTDFFYWSENYITMCLYICRTTWFSVKLYTSDCRALNLFSSQSLFSKSQVCLNSIIKIYGKCLYLHIFIDKKKMKMRIDGLSKSRYNCLPSICQIRVVPLPLVRLELSPFHVSDFAHPP